MSISSLAQHNVLNNNDLLENMFDLMFEMKPVERTSVHILEDTKYLKRMDCPWITASSRNALKTSRLVYRIWALMALKRLLSFICIDTEYLLDELLKALDRHGRGVFPYISMDLWLEFPTPKTIKLLRHSWRLKHLILHRFERTYNKNTSSQGLASISCLWNLHSLIISAMPITVNVVGGHRETLQPYISYEYLFSILKHTPRLRKLVLIADFRSWDHSAPPCYLPDLSCLEVMACDRGRKTHHFNMLEHLLADTNDLRELVLYGIRWFPSIPLKSVKSLSKLWTSEHLHPKNVVKHCSFTQDLKDLAIRVRNDEISDSVQDLWDLP